MPFAELPGSHIEGLQVPDWTRFAAQANEMIARQPVPDLAGAVEGAVNQINEILKLSSPEAKMERKLQKMKMQFQERLFREYEAHPEDFEASLNGPVYKDKKKQLALQIRTAKDYQQYRLALAKIKALGGQSPHMARRILDDAASVGSSPQTQYSSELPAASFNVPPVVPALNNTGLDLGESGDTTDEDNDTEDSEEEAIESLIGP